MIIEIGRFKKELIEIDDEDYHIISIHRWFRMVAKDTMYCRTYDRKNKKWMYMHRLILGITDTNILVDHKDGNGLNNKKDNLRACTFSDNVRNRDGHGVSKFKGVSLHQGRWWARYCKDGVQISLGRFDNEIDAAHAYNKAVKEYGNKFDRINKFQ